jgi:hypothetical protein
VEIAALIISVLSLVLSVASISWMIAKQLSTHTIQLQPVDSLFNPAMGKKIGSDFKEFDAPMDDDEKEYFTEQNKPRG